MELISIGEAARRLGMNQSALRYYEDRGLVRPATRHQGRRMYGPAELRRLAFLRIAQRLGIPLGTAASVFDEPGERWRGAVDAQIKQIDDLIARAEDARRFLAHALSCPAEHPARGCPYLLGALDEVVAGRSVEEIAAEHAQG